MVELMGELNWQLLKAMNLSPAYTEEIRYKLVVLSEQSTYAIEEIRSILASLDSLNTTLATEAGNVNFALVRADVLGYEQKQRVTGILMLQVKAIQRLGIIFSIKPNLTDIVNFCNVLGVSFGQTSIVTRVR